MQAATVCAYDELSEPKFGCSETWAGDFLSSNLFKVNSNFASKAISTLSDTPIKTHIGTLIDLDSLKPSNFSLAYYPILDTKISIDSFLSKHEGLEEFIDSSCMLIESLNRVRFVSLELYQDPEEGWEKAFLLVHTEIDDMQELDEVEDEIFERIFTTKNTNFLNLIVISVS